MKRLITISLLIIYLPFPEHVVPNDTGFIDQVTEKINQSPDLPVVITTAKVQKADAPLALLISGDGGWFYFEQKISERLADQGISTIGLDSKKYFWKRKTPEQTAEDISVLFSYYGKKLNRERFIMIGYSLGAEIVPFIVNRLPAELRSDVISVLLLSPDVTTDFEIHISNMIGIGNSQNKYDVVSEIVKMGNVSTLIIFGDEEKSKVPGLLKNTSVIIKMIPGDHHYKLDTQLIVKTMKENKLF